MLKPVNLPGEPAPPVYSQAIEATGLSRMLFISGQVGVASDGRIPAGIGDQARIAIGRVNALLAEAGLRDGSVVKLTIYLTDAALVPAFVEAASGSLPTPAPATTLLIVKALAHPALLVEIEAIAVG